MLYTLKGNQGFLLRIFLLKSHIEKCTGFNLTNKYIDIIRNSSTSSQTNNKKTLTNWTIVLTAVGYI